MNVAVGDILMWQEPKLSGAVFIGGLGLLLSLVMFSVISVIAHCTLVFMAANGIFCVYKIVSAAFQNSPIVHPFR